MKIARWLSVIFLAGTLGVVSAQAQQQTSPSADQSQQDSLAAAARRSREQKKDQPKAKKTWDNDTVSELSPLSIVTNDDKSAAPADQAADGSAKQGQPVTGEQPSDTTKKAPDNSAAVDAAKANVDNLKNQLDILQRKHSLDQQSYYGKPDYASDKVGAASLQDEQSQIDAKQQEVDEAEKKLDDLQAQSNSTSSPDSTAK